MPSSTYVLAIDLGTSGCKAALVSVHGRVVAWCFHAVDLRILPGGGAEQDPDDWWDALLESCGDLRTGSYRYKSPYPSRIPPCRPRS